MERIAPDLGPRGESDLDILNEALDEMDDDLVYVEGQGWMEPDDPAIEGLESFTRAELAGDVVEKHGGSSHDQDSHGNRGGKPTGKGLALVHQRWAEQLEGVTIHGPDEVERLTGRRGGRGFTVDDWSAVLTSTKALKDRIHAEKRAEGKSPTEVLLATATLDQAVRQLERAVRAHRSE
jgi:hypothetical protein